MEPDVDKLLRTLEDLPGKADVSACFGEPIRVGDRTVVPVAKVGYAFGVGAGQGLPGEGEVSTPDLETMGGATGGGGGLTSSPLGLLELTPDGSRFVPIMDRQKIATVGLLVGAWCLFWVVRALMTIFGSRGEVGRPTMD